MEWTKRHPEVKKRRDSLIKKGDKITADHTVIKVWKDRHKMDLGKNGRDVLVEVLKEVKVPIEMVSVKRGGRNYRLPYPVSNKRGLGLGRRYLLNVVKKIADKEGIKREEARSLECKKIAMDIRTENLEPESDTLKIRDHLYREAKSHKVYMHMRR